MRIIEDFSDIDIELIEITSAKFVGDFSIRVYFSNGINRLVDFKYFLESSLHPSIRKYLNEENFKQFEIIDGNLNWNHYDMIFPIGDLFEGKI